MGTQENEAANIRIQVLHLQADGCRIASLYPELLQCFQASGPGITMRRPLWLKCGAFSLMQSEK